MRRDRFHTLRTPRLTLRPLGPEDAEDIVEGLSNYDVTRWLLSVPYPYTLDDAREYLSGPLAEPGRAWAICAGGRFQGVISIVDELGYWLRRDAWGRGYATEAGDAAIDAWFADAGNGALPSGYIAGNARSAGALAKLGFRDTARIDSWAVPLAQTVATQRMQIDRARWHERRRFRLSTARLRIREVRPGDWRALHRIAGKPQVARMLYGVPASWSADDARAFVAGAAYRGRPGFRAALTTRLGRVIGMLGLLCQPGAAPSVSLFLDPARQGRGYAVEACRAFLPACFDRFDLPAITASHFVDDAASARLLGRLGFHPTGVAGEITSPARLEPAPVVFYRLERTDLKETA